MKDFPGQGPLGVRSRTFLGKSVWTPWLSSKIPLCLHHYHFLDNTSCTREYLAQMVSRLLLESAQSSLLCLLLTVPLVLICLGPQRVGKGGGGKRRIFVGVRLELSQVAEMSTGTMVPSLKVCTRMGLGRKKGELRVTVSLSPCLIQNSKESENFNLNMESWDILKVSFLGRLLEHLSLIIF